MKIRDVLLKYNKIVPFPWSVEKIEQAYQNPANLLMDIGKELAKCEDKKSGTYGIFLRSLQELEKILENPKP